MGFEAGSEWGTWPPQPFRTLSPGQHLFLAGNPSPQPPVTQPRLTPCPSLCSTVFAKNFRVAAAMKTSVLLSWEVPDSYKSAVPFKVGEGHGQPSPAHLPACPRASRQSQVWASVARFPGQVDAHSVPCRPTVGGGGGSPQRTACPSPPQILYNGQSVEVDGHSMRKLIADLQPNTEYSFVLMNRGSSAGGLQHLVSIRTAPDLLPHKPLPASAYIEDGRFTLSMPHVQDSTLIRCADEAVGGGGAGLATGAWVTTGLIPALPA